MFIIKSETPPILFVSHGFPTAIWSGTRLALLVTDSKHLKLTKPTL